MTQWTKRPGPGFIALRGAVLAIDDLSRASLRTWAADGLDHAAKPRADYTPPSEPAVAAIAAAWVTLPEDERYLFRYWVIRWMDYTGRLITPSERKRRREAHKT